jgi:hypothetical protein
MTHPFGIAAAIAALILIWPASAPAQWTLYDDFGGAVIDPGRFHVNDTIAGSSSPTAETLHVLSRGELRQLITQYGGVDSNSGSVTGAARLPINDPTGITAMRAQVIVTRAVAEACNGNPFVSRGHAEVIGRFFNDGTSTGPGDQTGDITAVTRKVLDPVEGAVIEAGMFRCANSSCSSTPSVVPTQNFNTIWSFNQAHTMTVQWDPANDQFIYSVKPRFGPEETVTLSYAGILSGENPPLVGGPDSLTLRALVANCAGDRKLVLMEALFDDLTVIRE